MLWNDARVTTPGTNVFLSRGRTASAGTSFPKVAPFRSPQHIWEGLLCTSLETTSKHSRITGHLQVGPNPVCQLNQGPKGKYWRICPWKRVTRPNTYSTPYSCGAGALLCSFLLPEGLVIHRQHHKNDFVIVTINTTFLVTHKGRAAQHTLANGHHSTHSLMPLKYKSALCKQAYFTVSGCVKTK